MFNRLYLHIPFCLRKCPYCSFVSRDDGAGQDDYPELLLREIGLAAQSLHASGPVDSVYWGGGTPSLLDPSHISEILETINRFWPLAADAEITLEANPGTIDRSYLTGLRTAGINRLSLGVQSFDDRSLQILGRIHTARDSVQAIEDARHAGFDNLGIDLIHALPRQTVSEWHRELKRALAATPDHISIYGLTIEEQTPFAALYPEGSSDLTDNDLSAAMSEAADDLLVSAGFRHYEIANYALPGRESRHNSGYWRRDRYLGLGAGAHTFLNDSVFGSRFSNSSDTAQYAAEVRQGNLVRHDCQELSREDAMAEFMFLGLRMAEGICCRDFEREFGQSVHHAFGRAIERLAPAGLLVIRDDRMWLTPRGMLLSNQVLSCFIP